METFEITLDKSISNSCDNYYEPLGIDEKRKDELCNHVLHVFAKNATADQVSGMHYLSQFAKTKEELIFLGYKFGEYCGTLHAGHDRSLPAQLAMQILLYKSDLDA